MTEFEEALEIALRSATTWVVIPLIVAFVVGLIMTWMS
jgi:hypothetical protein